MTAVPDAQPRIVRATIRSRVARFARKHRAALGALVLYHFILLFPILFMGRMFSPVDVYYNYDPWRSLKSIDVQNPLLNDPASAYLTVMSLLKDDGAAFDWNRYIASGVPGYGSTASGVVSPFVFVPVLLLPLSVVLLAIALLKLNFTFYFAYLWLREERIGKWGAAAGAMITAAAASQVVWWMWHGGNATSLYPALFFVLARIFHRKRVPFVALVALAVGFLVSGFPAAVAYAGWAALLYALWQVAASRFVPVRPLFAGLGACVAGLAIASPFLAPFVQFLRATGYLQLRDAAPFRRPFPLEHLKLFLDPWKFGDPTQHSWRGIAVPGASNNLVELSVYVGLLTLALVALGFFARRAKLRFFWAAFALLVLAGIYVEPVTTGLWHLPGIKHSPVTRLRVLLPLPAGYLAAAGASLLARWSGKLRRFSNAVSQSGVVAIPLMIVLVLALDLSLFAAHFYPYVPREMDELPLTPTVEALRAAPGAPFRVLPFFGDLWPNSAEIVRIEDVRSHFSSEAKYRAMLQKVDPEVFGHYGTILFFNSLRMNVSHPFVSMLNVRYFVEQSVIDIMRWLVYDKTSFARPPAARASIAPGVLRVGLPIEDDSTYAFEFRAGAESDTTRIDFRLTQPETGESLWSRSVTGRELRHEARVYVPVRQFSHRGNLLDVEISSNARDAWIATAIANDTGSVAYGVVHSPVIPYANLPDGRIYENLAALPRFFAVWNVKKTTFDEFLNSPPDPSTTAAVEDDRGTGSLGGVPEHLRRVRITIDRYDGRTIRLHTSSAVPFFLASSEKISPELVVRVDGKPVVPRLTNGLFAGLPLGSGEHKIELQRRIGRGWWLVSVGGLLLTAVVGFSASGARRSRTGTRRASATSA